MDNQPNSNRSLPEEEIGPLRPLAGRDYNHISGTTFGPNSITNVGGGRIDIGKYAGNDLFDGGKPVTPEAREFSDGMIKLRKLIVQAYKAGEISEKVARKAVKTLKDTAEIVTKDSKPRKSTILPRLEFVADILEAAIELVGTDTVKFLSRAVPLVGALIKIAGQIF